MEYNNYEKIEDFLRRYISYDVSKYFVNFYIKNYNALYSLLYKFYQNYDVGDEYYELYSAALQQIVLNEQLEKLYPLIINNYFVLRLYDNKTPYLHKDENVVFQIYSTEDNSSQVIRILNQFDIPINDDNFYLSVSKHDFLQLRFYNFFSFDPIKYNKLIFTKNKNDHTIYYIKNQILNLFVNYSCYISIKDILFFSNYSDRLINQNSVKVSSPENIYKWIQCYDKYVKQLESNIIFLDALRLYTHTGDVLMHSVMRKTFIEEKSLYPKHKLLYMINVLNYNTYVSHHFRINKCIEFNISENPLTLFRGFTGNVTLTNGSIINMLKNQFVSFTSDLNMAKKFGNCVFSLDIDRSDIEKYSFIPIENINSYDGNPISQHSNEKEWLFPIGTSFQVVDVLNILDNSEEYMYKYTIIIKIKIYNQEYHQNINESTFSDESLKNEYVNMNKFLYYITHTENDTSIVPTQ